MRCFALKETAIVNGNAVSCETEERKMSAGFHEDFVLESTSIHTTGHRLQLGVVLPYIRIRILIAFGDARHDISRPLLGVGLRNGLNWSVLQSESKIKASSNRYVETVGCICHRASPS